MSRRFLPALALALALTSGCALLPEQVSATEGTTSIDASGFTVTAGGVTATGGADVAPAGTSVALREVEVPEEVRELSATGSPVVDLSFGTNAPPAGPVTLAWQVPSEIPTDNLAFIGFAPNEAWRGVPVTMSGRTATVQLDRAGRGQFIHGGSPVMLFRDGVRDYLTAPPADPEPCETTVSVGAVEFTVTDTADALPSCVAADGGQLNVTVRSESAKVWLVESGAGAGTPVVTAPPGEITATTLLGRRPGLAPGGRASVTVAPDNQRERMVLRGQVNGVVTSTAALSAGVEHLITNLSGQKSSTDESRAIAQCVAGSVEFRAQRDAASSDPAALTPVVISCFTQISGPAGADKGPRTAAALAVAESLAAQLAGVLTQSAPDLTAPESFEVKLTRKASNDTSDLTNQVLTAEGLGPMKIGTPMRQVLANRWGVEDNGDCVKWTTAPAIERQGVILNASYENTAQLDSVMVTNSRIRTQSGANVGMTIAQVRRVYGDRLTLESKFTSGVNPAQVHTVRAGTGEILFHVSGQPTDNSRVTSMLARKYSASLESGC